MGCEEVAGGDGVVGGEAGGGGGGVGHGGIVGIGSGWVGSVGVKVRNKCYWEILMMRWRWEGRLAERERNNL